MDSTRLLEWLMNEKKLSIRSAKDGFLVAAGFIEC